MSSKYRYHEMSFREIGNVFRKREMRKLTVALVRDGDSRLGLTWTRNIVEWFAMALLLVSR
jgi:hypothetical protein